MIQNMFIVPRYTLVFYIGFDTGHVFKLVHCLRLAKVFQSLLLKTLSSN